MPTVGTSTLNKWFIAPLDHTLELSIEPRSTGHVTHRVPTSAGIFWRQLAAVAWAATAFVHAAEQIARDHTVR